MNSLPVELVSHINSFANIRTALSVMRLDDLKEYAPVNNTEPFYKNHPHYNDCITAVVDNVVDIETLPKNITKLHYMDENAILVNLPMRIHSLTVDKALIHNDVLTHLDELVLSNSVASIKSTIPHVKFTNVNFDNLELHAHCANITNSTINNCNVNVDNLTLRNIKIQGVINANKLNIDDLTLIACGNSGINSFKANSLKIICSEFYINFDGKILLKEYFAKYVEILMPEKRNNNIVLSNATKYLKIHGHGLKTYDVRNNLCDLCDISNIEVLILNDCNYNDIVIPANSSITKIVITNCVVENLVIEKLCKVVVRNSVICELADTAYLDNISAKNSTIDGIPCFNTKNFINYAEQLDQAYNEEYYEEYIAEYHRNLVESNYESD